MRMETVRVNKPLSSDTTITVSIKVTSIFKIRLWIGKTLIWLGAKALGAGIEFETEVKE